MIYNMDCIEGMGRMETKSINLVITDPPFGIEFSHNLNTYNRNKDNVLEGYNEVKEEDYLQFTKSWMKEMHRVLREDGSAYIFSGFNNLKDILISIDELGFTLINHIIWKYQFGVNTSRKYVTSHYHLLYICKNDKQRKFYPYARYSKEATDNKGGKLHYQDKEDVWYIKREYWKNKIKTPTKLPREIIEKILAYSSDPGDIVLDPFLGAGQVAVVSKLNDRKYIGFEVVKDYYNFAKERLDKNQYFLEN